MSVTAYEIGCNYRHPKLKNKVYFLSKSFFNPSTNEVTIHIDNGGASVSIVTHVPHPTPPNVIEGFGIKFTETESLDERYKFTKQLNIFINGHLTDTTWLLENDYYIMVETIEGTFYLINVDFPSKMSFTYNLSNSQDQTDFVFTSNSNFPALKVNSVPWDSFNTCKTYHVPGVDYLKLLEKGYATIDKENGVVNLFNSQTFKNIDYLKNTISLQETYDGDIATTTISFEIPFDDYKTSWQYNLLEFKQNLYVAEVGNANDNAIFAGFEHGLEPQYEINGSTSESESTSIKITLTEASNWGIFEYDSWSYYNVSEKKWVGVQSEYICLTFGIAGYTLMQEVDENGTPTGNYKCLASELERYQTDYNIIGTYNEPERFNSPQCSRSMTRGGTIIDYTCIDGNKYEIIAETVSYDNGKTYTQTEFRLGPMVESASTWCLPPPDYKWELDESESSCLYEMYDRWVESGYTCDGYNKNTTYYRQLSFDRGNTWVNTEPLETKEVISNCSDDCVDYYSKQYLTFEALEGCQFYIRGNEPVVGALSDYNLEYSVDSGNTWHQLIYAYNPTPVVPPGSTIIFAGHWPGDYYHGVHFESTGKFIAYGNINSLTYGHNFVCTYADNAPLPHTFKGTDIVSAENLIFPKSQNGFSNTRHYTSMFENCVYLITPPQNLPTTRLTTSCYSNMFAGCTSLTTAPELPATALAAQCYEGMFMGCTSLTTAPELPATTITVNCYHGMFSGCTSLTTAPELPATTIADYCYRQMFEGCTSLTEAPELPGTGVTRGSYIGSGSYERMFRGCILLTTAPELPAATLDYYCYRQMFEGCTSLTEAPELPITGFAGTNCCEKMFAGCTSLTTVPSNMLPATTMWFNCRPTGGTCYANSCYAYMFSGCTSLTTTPELPATALAAQCYEGMFEGCTSLTTAPDLPATNLSGASSAYTSMFSGCTSLTTVPDLPATTLSPGCYAYMFKNCVSLVTVPSNMLPATTLIAWCYDNMFSDCVSLIEAPELLATNINRSYCYRRMFSGCISLRRIVCLGNYIIYVSTDSHATQNWVDGVPDVGVFVMSSSSETWPIGKDGIPASNTRRWKTYYYEPAIYDWTVSGYTCDGYDKYERLVKVVSYDYAKTWEIAIPEEYDRGSFIESPSVDCGYDPTRAKYKLTLNDSTVISAACEQPNVTITSGQISAYSSSCVSAEIGECVTSLDKRCFYNFANLTSITISDSVTEIGKEAFNGCNSLPVENNIRYADTYAVGVTDKTLTSYVIKSGTRFIGNTAFAACTGMTSMVIPNSVISIGEGAFARCSGMTSIVLQEGLEKIVSYAFQNCRALTSITIPDSVTSLGSESEQVFGSCYGIQSVTIGNGLTSVYGFRDCTGVTSVTIGSSVTAISNSCFANRNLTTVICLAETPPSIGSGRWSAFYNTPITAKTGVVYVPAQSVDRYKGSGGWMEFKEIIQPIPT